MEPLMTRRDYGSQDIDYDGYKAVVKPVKEQGELIKLVIPQDYDSPILEEIVPEKTVPEEVTNPSLKCPYCSTSHSFNPQSLDKVKNFNCPDCSGNVPTVTVMRLANSSEYVSSIETVADELGLVEDVKDSLKVVKKLEPK